MKYAILLMSLTCRCLSYFVASKTNTSTAGSPASTETERLFKEKLRYRIYIDSVAGFNLRET